MKLGIDQIDDFMSFFSEKRVGLITNPTGINSNLKSTIDVLKEKLNLVALFAPEHGIRGDLQAGIHLESHVDEKSQITVFSLYTKEKKPTKEMLDQIDVLCIDIQDAGSRFYTYIYTMAYAMIACAEHNKEFVVFDRPNPINGIDVEGNILDLKYRSFIGYYPIVQRHGLTIGELALLFNTQYNINCALKIIPMAGWERKMFYPETGLLWIAPSPNLPTTETAMVYNATCIFEGTNVSEGRGTTLPFHLVGTPYLDPYRLSDILNGYKFPGVFFRPVFFKPTFSKHADKLCRGVQIHIFDFKSFKPVKVGWTMFEVIKKMYPNDFLINPPWREGNPTMLQYNTGCDYIQKGLYSLDKLYAIIERDSVEFTKMRERYLIY
ncbi:MAG: DUF1343 domain-containing protein [Bacilli bacterium]|nr:DUF1343 domain-containing protein [Bacilli bacterium]MDD4077379.1 DUF1343 domain-containing protein [Bacilli bacterium]MDD4387606.1 DUF1343 domain-containing protein [Bacilli bacterium]